MGHCQRMKSGILQDILEENQFQLQKEENKKKNPAVKVQAKEEVEMQEKKSLKHLKIKKLTIVGVIPSFAFQRAKFCALELHRKLPSRFPSPEIVGMLELDWSEKLQEWRQTLGREYWCLRRPVAVFFDNRFIGSDIELIKLVTIGNILMDNIPRKNMSSMKKHFRKDYITYLRKSKRIYCYLDICVDEVYAGTLTFQLYSDILPRTCENFKTLCLGSRGPLLSYRGSRIHRIVKKGWLQGGDIQYKTGGGGFSIFCDPLEDECFGISHDRRGVLSMASGGRHTNGSQFFITLQPSKWMDTNFVAFGQLIEGAKVLRTLENLDTIYECPIQKVEIKSCGKLDLEDVEDVDVMYKEEPFPAKKRKKIETISEQVVRMIMEALTEALARKERLPDILDDGDIPSKMNLQLYFQGFYSLPESVLEQTAQYLRNLRRNLLRVARASATEITEVLMYDLLMAVLTRMTTLDDVRETIGHELYNKMISGVEMKLELCQKSYVKKFIDQIVSTAESMVNLVSKKIKKMKGMSVNLKKFQDQMQGWVQSFVLQETFKTDNYFIAERPVIVEKPKEVEIVHPKREGIPCCEIEKKKKEEELKAKLRAKYTPSDLCCLGSKLHLSDSEINLYDYFSTCRYDLKKMKVEERMPLLDLIEIGRYKLKWIRKHENRVKSEERQCAEKKIRKWMSEVVYIPETTWLKETVFPRDSLPIDHVEEIMYGAMTAGLLEMYYFMEQYLKMCGGKKQKLVTRTIYPESDSSSEVVQEKPERPGKSGKSQASAEEAHDVTTGEETEGELEIEKPPEPRLKPCPCGHPCCKCPFAPEQPPTPPPSLEEGYEPQPEEGGEEEEAVVEEEEEKEPSIPPPEPTKEPEVKPCASDETLVDLNAILAEKLSLSSEEIDIKSFKWLKPYILEQGCDLKTEFVTQVHKWLEGERFNYKGFISKHSLVTRASLLSLSLSLAELIREENMLKVEVRNFIYDLWDLYFEEMIKEALLEYPPAEVPGEQGDEGEPTAAAAAAAGGGAAAAGEGAVGVGAAAVGKPLKGDKKTDEDEECKKIIEATPPFDFDEYCQKFGLAEVPKELPTVPEEKIESEISVQVAEQPERITEPKPEKSEVKTEVTPSKEQQKPEETQQEHEDTEEEPEQGQEKPPKPEAPLGDDEEPWHETTEPGAYDQTTRIDDTVMEEWERGGSGMAGDGDTQPLEKPLEKPPKKKKSPIVIQELVDVSSGEEIRKMPPYVLPFWVKFLTELTKQALGAIAKVSRLPRRLYFQTDSELAFDDKMKEWFEFNAFNPQPTKGREIADYIALHHKSMTTLEETARSFLKKKKLSELVNRCTRFSSAEDMAEVIVADVVDTAMKKEEENETLELFVSNLLSSAITSTPNRSQASIPEEEDEDFNTFDTDRKSKAEEEDDND